MRVLAIEKDSARHARLKSTLQPYVDQKIAVVRPGTLAERVDKVMEHIGDQPALFFLDPFGIEGLLVELLPKLLKGPQNEIFALFADVGANRLHAVLMTHGRDPDAEVAAVRSTPSLFDDFVEEDAQRVRVEAERSVKALRATQIASERILTEALGPEAHQELAGIPEGERREYLLSRFMRALREAGAEFVLALPMRDATSQRVYQLVYASKSAVGLRTMKEAMDSALRNSTLPEPSKNLIWAELQGNEDAVVGELMRHFVDREVRWSEDKDRRSVETVKRYLLERTAIFPMQFAAVKSHLEQAGFVVRKKPLALRFPRTRSPEP